MPKESGLGDTLYVDGKAISGDINSLQTIGCPMEPLPSTGIDKSAMERMAGLRDGKMEFTSYFNPDSLRAHPTLSTLPTTDRIVTYNRGTLLGAPAYSLVAKQIGYDSDRKDNGALTFKVNAEANAYGGEWGTQLTAGQRSDTGAANGTGVDLTTVSTAFGAQAYFHLFTFTGTLAAIDVQDSADNVSFATIAGLSFAGSVAAAGSASRAATGLTATIRRYLRVVTSGVFTQMTFSLMVNRNPVATAF